MRVADIQQLFQATAAPSFGRGVQDDNNNNDDAADGFSSLSPAEQARRTANLQQVLLTVQQLWVSGHHDLDAVAEILGDGSRDASWRIPIGKSGLLDFFLGILSVAGLRQSLTIHTLRLIGNSCADEDSNRARVVSGNHLANIVSLLRDDSILAFVIPVLYNICVDYEPAQLQASQAYLSRALIAIVSSPRLGHCRAFLNIICKILGLLVSQDCEASLADPATPVYLLALATNLDNLLDVEEFLVLLTVSLSYLTYEPFQEELIRQGAVQSLLTAYANTYSKYDVSQIEPEEAEELKLVRNRFTHTIADISGLASFISTYPLSSPVVKLLVSWVSNRHSNANLKATACFALGNLARSDESSISLVHDFQIHTAVINLLSKYQPTSTHPLSLADDSDEAPPPSQLLYAALSFLKNLAIPVVNKPVLGVLLDQPANILPRLWATTDTQPQVQFAAVSLTRLLLVSCPENVRRICSPLSPDPSSPAHDRSNVHVLSTLFNRIDAENTKTEAARAMATICRVLHSAPPDVQVLSDDWEPTDGQSDLTNGVLPLPQPPNNVTNGADSAVPTVVTNVPEAPVNARRVHFYTLHWDIADSLSYLMTQEKFPVLRSEVWFISALMGRSPDGARLIMRALHPFEACRALVEAVCGRDMFDGHELIADFPDMIERIGATGSGAAAGSGLGKSPASQTLSPVPRRSLDEISADTLPASNGSSGATTATSGTNGVSPASASALTATSTGGAPASSVAMGIEGLGLEPQQVETAHHANIARVDRENGLVLIAEVLKNYGDFLPFIRRGLYEQILQTGGEMVIHAQATDLEK